MYQFIAKDLGVLPDSRAQVIVCVEGPNDIAFFKNLSESLLNGGYVVPDFNNDPRVVLLPLGGDTLRDWVNGHYLKNIGKPEVHIYDRDDRVPPKYQSTCDAVNARDDDSIAFVTLKRESENYIHAAAIEETLNIQVTYTDDCDVPTIVGNALGVNDRTAKRRLNRITAKRMTKDRLDEVDPDGEVMGWFNEVLKRCS